MERPLSKQNFIKATLSYVQKTLKAQQDTILCVKDRMKIFGVFHCCYLTLLRNGAFQG